VWRPARPVEHGVSNPLYERLKGWVYRYLPAPLLAAIQRRHYLNYLRSFIHTEEPDLSVALCLVNEGDTAVDIGANVGVYTKALSERVGSGGAVISIEPVRNTFEILSHNVRRLGLNNVELLNTAVSSEVGEAVMCVPRHVSGVILHYQARITAALDPASVVAYRERVMVQTLDYLVRSRKSITFIKCDVEGHELECVTGSLDVIAHHRPAWLIEVAGDPDQPGSKAARLFALLRGHGYEAWMLCGQRLQSRRRGMRSTNYFFLTATQVTRLCELDLIEV
jgi:FkbM family methyltransferase